MRCQGPPLTRGGEAPGPQGQPGPHVRLPDRERQPEWTHPGARGSLCPRPEKPTELSLHTRTRWSSEGLQGATGAGGSHTTAHCSADSTPGVRPAAPPSEDRQTGGGRQAQGPHRVVPSDDRGPAEEWASAGPGDREAGAPRAKDTATSVTPWSKQPPMSAGGPPQAPHPLPEAQPDSHP